MPFSDPDRLREYQREYHARYAEEKRDEIAERRAAWFQERKETARVLQRVYRALKRCGPAMAGLSIADQAAARSAVTAWATNPDLPVDVVVSLWRMVSPGGRARFLEKLPTRERGKWEELGN